MRLALQQLDGQLAGQVRAARGLTLEVLAYLTATIDFPEEDIPTEETLPRVRQALRQVQGLLAGADQGILYRQGVRAAIVGRPNVGKSSLLNALLRQSRAIVTPIPGTTRDTIEETLNLHGLPVVLVDTAGISATDDLVEQLGGGAQPAGPGHRRPGALRHGRQPAPHSPRSGDCRLPGRQVRRHGHEQVRSAAAVGRPPRTCCLAPPWSRISALTGQGMDRLEETMVETVLGGQAGAGDAALVTTPRHQDALRRAAEHLAAAVDGLASDRFADCVTIDLTAAANALGEITGETASEDLLQAIFSRFCIGK